MRCKRPKARPCDPLTSKKDIDCIRNYLRTTGRNGDRNALIVTVGCNVGLRASDLCVLRVGDVNGTEVDVIEQKTKKRRIVPINKKMRAEVEEYVRNHAKCDDDWLFPSEKGGHIQAKYIHRLMKSAARAVGIKGNIGSHTLRKTMAYHALKSNKGNPEVVQQIQQMFNHTSIQTTKLYLKSSAELEAIYSNLNL